ncbi:hypothetical protein DTO013E5_6332 [Penicillium roqueforti]|uniref:uncharacterized protein n=1 Tax=Penicillium roqueforti TaxID=5082 RepID=UPI00190CE739|nr:uncharacterized protein LCP9604111_5297 [Penicillium roqueforti]KAF9248547.1 hypothetical protein LCP9604111_5297 [Penicillium roqueforti]KAI1832175.1 hypothetical protein CBS147337_6855 [Penicillium roqueforti]KAI2674144.1 hypothetical protein CBS147355_7319 [Penicillium roqueforti]KAI2682091.1 hypothetical protein LCP963914a_6506 [Penicillium roqueforti]KAI2699225.1 hypothetical protein CBS147372_6472 [Penicillium roqueforti]
MLSYSIKTPLVTCSLNSDWLERHDLKATVDHHHRLSHTPLVSSGELSFASLLPFVILLGFLKELLPPVSSHRFHPPTS